jgi:hypothetical protein
MFNVSLRSLLFSSKISNFALITFSSVFFRVFQPHRECTQRGRSGSGRAECDRAHCGRTTMEVHRVGGVHSVGVYGVDLHCLDL